MNKNNTPLKVSLIDYYEEFECIGSKCELNCCSSWKIIIDDNSIDKYKELDKTHGSSLMKNIIISDDTKNKNSNYIELNNNGYCPLLENDGLCSIVKNFGADTLSLTCNSFPRYGVYLKGIREYYLTMTLGCPEAARKSIMREKPLTMNSTSLEKNRHHDTPDYKIINSTENSAVLLEISEGILKLLQQREVPIKKRLATILLLCQEMDANDIKNNNELAKHFASKIKDILNEKQQKTPPLASSRASQFDIFTCFISITENLSISNNHTPFYAEVEKEIRKCFNGIGVKTFDSIDDSHITNYDSAYNKHIAPYLGSNPHIQENLFASQLIKPLYLFSNPENKTTTLKHFFHICTVYLLTVGLATGAAAFNDKITDDDMIKAIFLMHRFSEKNPQVENIFYQLAKDLGQSSVDQIYTTFS